MGNQTMSFLFILDACESLYKIIQEYYPEIDESSFIDSVQNNLIRGRFLLTIIGDGIRENMEEMTAFIHRSGSLNFTLSLVEIPVYTTRVGDLIITPRVLARTKEIERTIYTISNSKEPQSLEAPQKNKSGSKSISEQVFFERLELNIGREETNKVEHFISEAAKRLNLIIKLGRGKKASINLKSPEDVYNFASIQEDGEVWFYGIINSTEEIGNIEIGLKYLTKLANLVNGEVDKSYSKWRWCVKRRGEYIGVSEYVRYEEEWIELISKTIDDIRNQEEMNE